MFIEVLFYAKVDFSVCATHAWCWTDVSVHSMYNEEQSQFASVYTFKMYQIWLVKWSHPGQGVAWKPLFSVLLSNLEQDTASQ